MNHKHYHRGSSLIFLGFSVIIFIISYGVLFTLMPQILGMFYSALEPVEDPEWEAVNVETQTIIQYLVPLIPTIGIFILVIKVLMVASVRGRD